ncbi:hypothetical protein Tco_0149298 [Tanacetum coccineum]
MMTGKTTFLDETKGRAFTQESPWAILRKHPKWDAAEPVDLDEPVDPDDDTGFTELFRDDSRPRPPTNHLRLKWEATQEMYVMTKAKDATIMRLEEIKFLSTSTAGLSDDDAFIINMQKEETRKNIDVMCSRHSLFDYALGGQGSGNPFVSVQDDSPVEEVALTRRLSRRRGDARQNEVYKWMYNPRRRRTDQMNHGAFVDKWKNVTSGLFSQKNDALDDIEQWTRLSSIVQESIRPLRSILSELKGPKLRALVIDIFCTGVFELCNALSIPVYSFFTASGVLFTVSLYLPSMDREGEGDQYVDLSGTVEVPGCSPIRIQDLQELHVWNRNSEDYKCIASGEELLTITATTSKFRGTTHIPHVDKMDEVSVTRVIFIANKYQQALANVTKKRCRKIRSKLHCIFTIAYDLQQKHDLLHLAHFTDHQYQSFVMGDSYCPMISTMDSLQGEYFRINERQLELKEHACREQVELERQRLAQAKELEE